MSIAAAAVSPPQLRYWTISAIILAAATALWAVVYRDPIVAAVQTWWISPTYSHCFLVIPISAFLVYLKREQLARLTPEPYAPAILLAIPAGLLWLAGRAVAINEAQQLAAVAIFQMIVLAILGPRIYRLLLFPCLFLFFLVPMGQYLVMPMQALTTDFVSSGLTFLGILHYTEGNIIQLANGTFEVAEACAGLRFLVATIVLCVLFAHLAFRKPYKIAIFLAASVLVPLVANGLRALGIVLIAHWTDNRLAVGADHLIYGWGFSVFVLLVLFLAGSRFRDRIDPDATTLSLPDMCPPSLRRFVLLGIGAGFMLCVPAALADIQASLSPHAALQIALPARPGWSRGPFQGPWAPDLPAGDTHLRLSLRTASAPPVDFVLDYYGSDDKGRTMVVALDRLWDERRYNLLRADTIAEDVGGRRQELSELVLGSGRERRLVWWAYWKDGQFTTRGAVLKWLSLKDAFRHHTGPAFIALSVPVTGDENDARTFLRSALWSFGILPTNEVEKN